MIQLPIDAEDGRRRVREEKENFKNMSDFGIKVFSLTLDPEK